MNLTFLHPIMTVHACLMHVLLKIEHSAESTNTQLWQLLVIVKSHMVTCSHYLFYYLIPNIYYSIRVRLVHS